MTPQSPCDQAVRLHQEGRLAEAEPFYLKALENEPKAFIPRHLLGILRLQQGRNEEALALIGAALKINPDHAEALVNYGNALKQCGRAEQALASFDQALALRPDYAGAPYNRAILLADLGRMDEALESYAKALAIRPDFVPALHERALLLQALKRNTEALADFDRLLVLKADLAEGWNNRGVLLEDLNRFDEALACFDLVLGRNPAFAEAWHNRGNILGRLKRFDEALASYDRALALKPSAYPKAWTNRGILLMEMRRFADAMDSFTRALAIDPDDAGALHQRGRLAWLEFHNYDAALTDLERAVALDPERINAPGDLAYLKMHGGDWRERARDIALLNQGVRAGKPVVEPFIYQGLSDSPADLLACAVIHAARRFPAMDTPRKSAKRKPGKIRVGYLSGEFREQATAYLTAGLYECHDKEKFEIIAFDNGVNDHSPMRKRLEAGFDKFVDISKLSDSAAAALIAGEDIDILVNLNGYFGESRTGIFAHRPAPIQVSFLGFPATLGAPYMDYIVADHCVIPSSEKRYYTEKVVIMPHSYQVNDSLRTIAAKIPSRSECGLPENAFVFCNFNTSYKLAPEIFARWMTMLKLTPGSVLWLLEGHPKFGQNIRREATAAGVEQGRIVFAPKLAVEDHLARLTLADLFLDTLPYNAHTTASDALWAGVPLITCRGTSFPGRVAASLLTAVGLPELVTESLDAYQALAVKLAGDPALLARLRKKLGQNRLVLPLFDTARYSRNLEAAYVKMVETWQNGRPAEGFAVSPGL